jgi:hypothetical protein
MADYGTYDISNNPAGPEKPRVFGLKVISDIDILRRNGWGDGLTPVAGSTRLYDAGGGSMGMKIIQDDGSTEVEALGGEYVLRAELDCAGVSGIELKYPRIKGVATGALIAVGAGNEAVMEFDNVRKRITVGADAGGKRTYLGRYDIDGTHFKRMPLRLGDLAVLASGGLNTDDATATQATPSTPALLDLWENEDGGNGVDVSAAAGTITIQQPGEYHVSFQASIETSNNNVVAQFHLRKNTVEEPEGLHRKIGTANDVGSGGFVGLIDCDAGDVLTVYVETDISTNLKLIDGQFIAVRVGARFSENVAEPRTSDGVTGLRMDDANDNIVFFSAEPIPFDYTGGHDALIEVVVRLDQAETATDVIDLQADYVTALLGVGVLSGATTNATDTGLVQLGAGGTALGTLHRVIIPLTYNDATNPIAADAMIKGVLKRDGLADINSITVLAGNLLVPVFGGVDYQT